MGTIYIIFASILWCFLHSYFASQGFKLVIRKLVGDSYFQKFYRLYYNLFAFFSLLPVLVMLKVFPDRVLYRIPYPWLYFTLFFQGLAALLIFAAILKTNALSFIGLDQFIKIYTDANPERLVSDGFYRYLRHPIYFASLIFIWLTPVMTQNLLALWITFSAYIVVGAHLEERKLLQDFGSEYKEYQSKTPMFIPFLKKWN